MQKCHLAITLAALLWPLTGFGQTFEITRELSAPTHQYSNNPPFFTSATDFVSFSAAPNVTFAITDYTTVRLRLVAPTGKKFVCTQAVRLSWPGDLNLIPVGSVNSGVLHVCPSSASFTMLAGTAPVSTIEGFKTDGDWLKIRCTGTGGSSANFEFTELVLEWNVTAFSGTSHQYAMSDAGGFSGGPELDFYQPLASGAPDPGQAVFLQDIVVAPACAPNSNTWPVCGSPVAVRPGPQVAPSLAADGSGGFFISYVHADSIVARTDVWLNRLDANGAPVGGWPANGVPVCQAPEDQSGALVVSDGAGGALVAWSDHRNDPVELFYDVYVQRMTGSGSVALGWPVNGVPAHTITPGTDDENLSGLVGDGANGAFVSWSGNARVNRVTGSGTIHPNWPATGLLLGSGNSLLLGDGAGGVYACWRNNTDLRLVRLTPLGAVASGWPAAGLVLATGSGSFAFDVAANGSHVNVLWSVTATGDLRATRVTSGGAFPSGWSQFGLQVTFNSYPKSNLAVSHGGTSGDVVFVYREDLPAPATFQLVAQRLTPTGTVASGWPIGGWQVVPDANPLRTVPDCDGGTTLAFLGQGGIRAIRFTSAGAVAAGWPAGGVLLCGGGFSTVVSPIRNWAVPDGTGGVVTAVSRVQPGSGSPFDRADIHAQCVRGDGSAAEGYARSTEVGSNVTTQVGPARITFANVIEGGETFVEIAGSGPPPPFGVQLVPSSPPVYYDVTTLAEYSGPVEVCITYDPATVQGDESALQLLHYDETALPPAWVDITTFVDVVGNMICGSTPSLSPFIVVESDPTDVSSNLPSAYRLLANIPNPFNPATTIRYELASGGPVRLEILDVSGRLVRTLVDARVEAGRHEAVWRGQDEAGNQVASGVYFYRLQAGTFASTRRMVLLK